MVALRARTGTFSEQNERISPILENASLKTFCDEVDEEGTPLNKKKKMRKINFIPYCPIIDFSVIQKLKKQNKTIKQVVTR